MEKSDKYLMKYIKRNVNGLKNQRVGVVVSVVEDGKVRYGWSLAKVRPNSAERLLEAERGIVLRDKFDPVRGIGLALDRLNARNGNLKVVMPQSVQRVLRDRTIEVKEVKDGHTVRTKKVVRGFETRSKAYFDIA